MAPASRNVRPPGRSLSLLFLGLALAACGGASPAGGGSGAGQYPTPPGGYPGPAAVTVIAVPMVTASQVPMPSLSAAQRQQAIDVALNDTRVVRLLGDRPHSATDVALWTKGGPALELLGGVVTIKLDGPATIEGEWLGLGYDCSERAQQPGVIPYNSKPYEAKYSNVTSLTVFVDLQRGQVAGIGPDHQSRAEGRPSLGDVIGGLANRGNCRD